MPRMHACMQRWHKAKHFMCCLPHAWMISKCTGDACLPWSQHLGVASVRNSTIGRQHSEVWCSQPSKIEVRTCAAKQLQRSMWYFCANAKFVKSLHETLNALLKIITGNFAFLRCYVSNHMQAALMCSHSLRLGVTSCARTSLNFCCSMIGNCSSKLSRSFVSAVGASTCTPFTSKIYWYRYGLSLRDKRCTSCCESLV